MKTESRFNFFGDISELHIMEDDAGVISVSGTAKYLDADYSISLSRSAKLLDTSTAPPLIRGTVSLRDPRTGAVLISEAKKRKASGKDSSFKTHKASKDLKLRSMDVKSVAVAVEKAVARLYEENHDQLTVFGREAAPPGIITLSEAVRLYLEKYLHDRYPDSSDESNNRRAQSIRSTSALIPNVPMVSINPKDIDKVVKKHRVSKGKLTDLRLFWEFCLAESICGGILPFQAEPIAKRMRKNYTAINRAAGSLSALNYDVWCQLLDDLFNNPLTATGCGVLLLMNGFRPEFIADLTWGDVVIENDTVLIKFYRNNLAGSKHNFSRDLFGDAATYISAYYREISQNREPEDIGKQPVLWSEALNQKLDKKKLSDEAVRLMNYAGASSNNITEVLSYKKALSPTLLNDTFAALLETRCGLSRDKDSLYFLTGRVLHSSSYMSYECHTDSLARARFRQLMTPLNRPRKVAKTRTSISVDGTAAKRFYPSMTDEMVTVTGTVTLAPGETLLIRSRFGMTGTIKPYVEDIEEET